MRQPGDIGLGARERSFGEGLKTLPPDGCPLAEELIAFVEDRLEATARSYILRHLGRCSACRDTVYELRATDRIAFPKRNWWGRLAPGFALAFGLAGVAGAIAIGAVLVGRFQTSKLGGSTVAVNDGPRVSPNNLRKDVGNDTKPGNDKGGPASNMQPSKNKGSVALSSAGGGSTLPAVSSSNSSHTNPNTKPPKSREGSPDKPKRTTHPESGNEGTRVAMNGNPGSVIRSLRFLVGARHVYSLGDSINNGQDQRVKIEKDYADRVAADQDAYENAIKGGGVQDIEERNLKAELDAAANERDDRLAAIYDNADKEREAHPELKVDGDGPYQVVEVTAHVSGESVAFDNIVVREPWPGYPGVVVGPYGWGFGIVYSPASFRSTYLGWQRTSLAPGRPAYYGLVGSNGLVSPRLIVRGANRDFAVLSVPHSSFGGSAGPSSKYAPNARRFAGSQPGSSPFKTTQSAPSGKYNRGLSERSAPPMNGSGSRYGNSKTTSPSRSPASKYSPSSHSPGSSPYSRPGGMPRTSSGGPSTGRPSGSFGGGRPPSRGSGPAGGHSGGGRSGGQRGGH